MSGWVYQTYTAAVGYVNCMPSQSKSTFNWMDTLSLSGFTDKYRSISTNGTYHPIDHHINTISAQYQQQITQPYLPPIYTTVFAIPMGTAT